MFIVSKIAYVFLTPFVWVLIITILLLILQKNKAIFKKLLFINLFLLFFFSNTAIFKFFMHKWEIHGVKIEEVNKKYKVGLVLGGMFEFDNDLTRLSVRRGGDRIWQALSLYKLKIIEKIMISGNHGFVFDRGLNESEQLREVLIQFGIEKDDIIIETKSKNTFENAVESVRILNDLNILPKEVLLITSAFHMRRSLKCFQKQEFMLDVFSTDQYTGKKLHINWDEYFWPSGSTFIEWQVLIKEWVGFVSYRVLGRL